MVITPIISSEVLHALFCSLFLGLQQCKYDLQLKFLKHEERKRKKEGRKKGGKKRKRKK